VSLKKSFTQNDVKNDIIVTIHKIIRANMNIKQLVPLVLAISLQAETLNEVLNNAIEANPDVNRQLKYYESVLQDLEIAKSGTFQH